MKTFTNIEQFLKDQVAMLAKYPMAGIGGYKGIADFLVKEGRQFESKPLPKQVRKGQARYCFENCMRVALHSHRWIYCEGYAVHIIPVLHAWLLDVEDNKVIDPTWTGGRGRPPISPDYFGVAIIEPFVLRHIAGTRLYSAILDNYHAEYPLLRTPVAKWKHQPQPNTQNQ